MTSPRIFTRGQWATAAGIALSLHVLLAWSLIAHQSVHQPSPADGGGLAVESISLGDASLPLLTDIAEDSNQPAALDQAATTESILQPVAPPDVRPMTEIVPVKPQPKRKKASPKRSKPDPAARRHRQARKTAPASTGKVTPRQTRPGTAAGADAARGAGKTAGVSRAAAPQAGNPRPRYPTVARKRGHEGRVVIRVSVLGNGRVGSASIAGSSGHGALDRAALKAVRRWRFKPALRAGKPVTATVNVPVVFRLQG